MSATDHAPPGRPWRRPALGGWVAEAYVRAAPHACPRCGGPAKVTTRLGNPEPVVAVYHRHASPTRPATR